MTYRNPYDGDPGTREECPVLPGESTMHILVVEDDDKTADYITKGLGECGFVTDRAANGPDGLHMATSGNYDAVILDRMLPGLDGLSVVRALRAAEVTVPVLILSAGMERADRLAMHLSNEGLLISEGDTDVLFDPLFRNNYGQYQLITQEIDASGALFLELVGYCRIDAVVNV